MPSINKRMEHQLESLIDELGLTFVLERIVSVCHDKARYFESTHDSESVREWTNAGNRIDELPDGVEAVCENCGNPCAYDTEICLCSQCDPAVTPSPRHQRTETNDRG